jgi:hypothetical protein
MTHIPVTAENVDAVLDDICDQFEVMGAKLADMATLAAASGLPQILEFYAGTIDQQIEAVVGDQLPPQAKENLRALILTGMEERLRLTQVNTVVQAGTA